MTERTTVISWNLNPEILLTNLATDLRLLLMSAATLAHSGTKPLRVLLTTNATARDAISRSSIKFCSSSEDSVTRKPLI